jgi:hypothetical protein
MKGLLRLFSRAHENNRVMVPAASLFRRDKQLAARYLQALESGTRLRVCLEGDSGHGKGEMLARLGGQGYATSQLPFVPWLVSRGVASSSLTDEELARLSREWQAAWHARVEQDAAAKTGRAGLLFVSRSPATSSVELARRGLGSKPPPPDDDGLWVAIALDADETQVQRRMAGKTFDSPESAEARLRERLARPAGPSPLSARLRVDSTSAKQAVAALLCLAGVPEPVFPPARPAA